MDELKQYKVVVLPAALHDIELMITDLNGLSPRAAQRLLNEFTDGISSLKILPERCPHVRVEHYARLGYRYLIIRYYLVIYSVSGDTVFVRRIVNGRSDYAKAL